MSSWSASYLIAITVMTALENATSQSSLTCYSCLKSDTSWNSTNTCPESFQSPGANTCQGKACLMILSDYEGDGSVLNVSCLTNELDQLISQLSSQVPLSVAFCNVLNQLQSERTFYIFDGMCCTTEPNKRSQANQPYNKTLCACDSEYCNRNLTSFQIRSGPTTAGQFIETTADQVIVTTASGQGSICQQSLIAPMVSLTAVAILV